MAVKRRQIVVRYRIDVDSDSPHDVDAEINAEDPYEHGEGMRALAIALGKVFAEEYAEDHDFALQLEVLLRETEKRVKYTAEYYRDCFKKKDINLN